jgi:hypothetical protein
VGGGGSLLHHSVKGAHFVPNVTGSQSQTVNLIEEGGRVFCPQITPQGVLTLSTSRLESRHNQHWPDNGTAHRCRVYSANKIQSRTLIICLKYNVAMCFVPYFFIYHTNSKI